MKELFDVEVSSKMSDEEYSKLMLEYVKSDDTLIPGHFYWKNPDPFSREIVFSWR